MRLTAEGDAGSDRLRGTHSRDVLRGGFGNDILNADDNAPGDVLDCGQGNDVAIFNVGDLVSPNCESARQA